MSDSPHDWTQLASEASGGRLASVIAGGGVLERVAELVDQVAPPGSSRVLLSDGVRKLVGDRDVEAHVRKRCACERTVIAPAGSHGVVLDEATVDAACAELTGAGVVVAVGSGTIADLAKVASARHGVPAVAVQTAASVNGYSDPLSVLVINGAKRTRPSAWVTALLIDYEVLRDAPLRLTRSGVGDAVAIGSAAADWYLSCSLGMGGSFDDTIVRPVIDAVSRLHRDSPGDPLDALVTALTVGGLSIGLADSTAPLSGCEHLVSHVLDMAAMAAGEEHDLHGTQVGVATVVATALWQEALADPGLFARTAEREFPEDLADRVRDTWAVVDPSGALGEECLAAVEKKQAAWRAASRADFDAAVERHLGVLTELAATPESATGILASWGAPTTFAALTPTVSPERARWALSALPFMRDRLTLPDLFVMAGRWDDDLFDRILARTQ